MGEDLPTLPVADEGITVVMACTALGLTASNGEAKRKVKEGAVKLDDERIDDPQRLLRVAPGGTHRLSVGKKRHGILVPQ